MSKDSVTKNDASHTKAEEIAALKNVPQVRCYEAVDFAH